MAEEHELEQADRIRVLEQTLDRQLYWIAGAERRVAFVFAADIAILGLAAGVGGSNFLQWSFWSVVAGALSSASLFFITVSMFPRTEGPKQSVLYFGGISEYDPAKYRSEMGVLSAAQYIDDLAGQCHVNARIAAWKYRFVKWSMGALLISALACAIAQGGTSDGPSDELHSPGASPATARSASG